jgi:transcriptional regulator with PAS, ATPase and Fis domain
MVGRDEFRDDLYFRIRGFVFKIPPLRERKEDIDLLGNHFLEKYAAHYQTQVSKLSPLVRSQLKAHDWPGNGRELESVIHEAVALCEGDVVERVDLPPAYQETDDTQTSLAALMAPIIIASERQVILAALQQQGGHRGRTAEVLGISPRTLYRKMLIYEITILS